MNIVALYSQLHKRYDHQGWWPVYIPPVGGITPGKPIFVQGTIMKDKNGLREGHGLTYGIPYGKLKNYYTPFRDPYFEIAIGAILTQNTAWKNVAIAIKNLHEVQALRPELILKFHPRTLEKLIRSAGYYRQKAKKLRIFCEWLVGNHDGNILRLKRYTIHGTRDKLLQLWGIGKETADSILLYALNKPIFMIDEYTRRLCRAHGVEFSEYDEYRRLFEDALRVLPRSHPRVSASTLYQEFHALIVAWGQEVKKE